MTSLCLSTNWSVTNFDGTLNKVPELEPVSDVAFIQARPTLARAVSGYIARTNRLDDISRAFDDGRLAFANRRIAVDAKLNQVAARARDIAMLGGLILVLAGAGLGAGESFSPLAWALITLAPGLIFVAKTWSLSSRLALVDCQAGRVREELKVIEARRAWLQRAARIVPVLMRSLQDVDNGVVLDADSEIADVIKRALSAERKLKERRLSRRYPAADLIGAGWRPGVQIQRRSLAAAALAAAINSVIFGAIGRPTPTIVCGLAATVFAGLRYLISNGYVSRRRVVVSRLSIWNKQRDLLADLDKKLRSHADAIVARYEQSVVIDLC